MQTNSWRCGTLFRRQFEAGVVPNRGVLKLKSEEESLIHSTNIWSYLLGVGHFGACWDTAEGKGDTTGTHF